MTTKRKSEPFWMDEPDWLCAVEFLNDEDPEGRDLAAVFNRLPTRLCTSHEHSVVSAPRRSASEMAYEILFSFSSPEQKTRFMDLVRSNDDLGNEYIDNDLLQPVKDEIREARPIATVLPQESAGAGHISRSYHLQRLFRAIL